MYSRNNVGAYVDNMRSLQSNQTAELQEVLSWMEKKDDGSWDYEELVMSVVRLRRLIKNMKQSDCKDETFKGLCFDRKACAYKILYMLRVLCPFYRFKMKHNTIVLNECAILSFFLMNVMVRFFSSQLWKSFFLVISCQEKVTL